MNTSSNTLYSSLLDEIRRSLDVPPDQPNESPEATLRALWHAAAGTPHSSKQAMDTDLAELTEQQQAELRELIVRRLSGVPLIQLTRRANFMGLELEFAPDVFLVRPETELLAHSAIAQLKSTPKPVIIDVGCGSGNISCAIASKLNDAVVYAVDLLDSCIALTQRNAERCGVADRITILKGDLFAPLENYNLPGKIDAIVCNPPYIASGRLETNRAYLTDHEPLEAFDGGPFGIRMQQRLISESPQYLKPKGILAFEFGAGQDRQVEMLFKRAGGFSSVNFQADEGGTNRVVVAER